MTSPPTPPSNPPVSAGLAFPQGRRPPPRRYPAVGFGLLALFVGGTYAAALGSVGTSAFLHAIPDGFRSSSASGARRVPSATEEPGVTPIRSMEASLVRSARALQAASCLHNATVPLDVTCRAAASSAIQNFSQIVKQEISSAAPGELNATARALRPVAIQLNGMVLSVLPQVQRTSSTDQVAQLSVNAFDASARDYIEKVNAAYDLSAARWGSSPSLGGSADTEPPQTQQDMRPQESAAGEVFPASGTEAEHRDDSAPPRDPTLINGLVSTVRDVERSFEAAGHDTGQVINAVLRARPVLDQVDRDLQRYRDMPHGNEDAQGRAQAFVTRIDQARGHLLRAAIEMQQATLITGEPLEPPFRKADDLLERAAEDVRLAEKLAKMAP